MFVYLKFFKKGRLKVKRSVWILTAAFKSLKCLAVTPEFVIYNTEYCKEAPVANFHISHIRYEATQLQMRMQHWVERTERDFRHLICRSVIVRCLSLEHTRRQVATTNHSVCTNRATSCSNTLRRHIGVTNRFMCTWEFLWKSLHLQQNFCRRSKSHKFCLIWFFSTCCCDKILLQKQRFSQKVSSTHEAICRTCRQFRQPVFF